MQWILLTFLSILFRSVYGVMTKVLTNSIAVTSYTQAFLFPLAAALISIVVSPLNGGISLNFSGVNLYMFALVIICPCIGNIIYFAAVKKLTSSTAQISFSSVIIFNTILSILFLNLQLSIVNFLGIFVLISAIGLVTFGKIEINKKGISIMILSALLFSIFQLASSQISKQISGGTYLFFSYMGSALIVLALKRKIIFHDLRNLKNRRSAAETVFLTALPNIGYLLFSYYAYRAAPEPAKVAILLTSQVVMTVFLSYIFLKERTHVMRKVIASILVLIAAYLIKN